MAMFKRLADVSAQLVSINRLADAAAAAKKQAFIDLHNEDQDPPVEIADMDEDDGIDQQLDVLDFMQQMGERIE